MGDLLLYADTERSAALRHEVPVAIGDPFLFAETAGRARIMTSRLEHDRIAAARPDAGLLGMEELGFHELLRSGGSYAAVMLELASRACERFGIREATVPDDFPVGLADRLRADGIVLRVDGGAVEDRRRAKAPAELEGIRAAQRAAEAGMAAAEGLLARADARDGWLTLDGEPLTAEAVRAALRDACAAAGAPAPPDVIVASVHQGSGHDPGTGPLPAGLPIQVDAMAARRGDGVLGRHDPHLRRRRGPGGRPRAGAARARRAGGGPRARPAPASPGASCTPGSATVFEAAGHRTQRTGPGDDPTAGFQFSLGHGVGLEVHEAPGLGMLGPEPLVAGDVLAVEPGLWERGIGGVRYEDLLLVTEDGCETLTRYPYDLAPRADPSTGGAA